MTSLTANDTQIEGCKDGAGIPTKDALTLLVTLQSVDVLGRQMFERDCLAFTFDVWSQSLIADAADPNISFSANDVLSDISDIRSLPANYPEIAQVDPELLDAITDIEQFVLTRMPSMH